MLASTTITQRDALIMLCDIVDYSLEPREVQMQMVEKLWNVTLSQQWLGPEHPNQDRTHMWGTGDGFYLVIWDSSLDSIARLHQFACDLIDQMRADSIQIRIALHYGRADLVRTKQPQMHVPMAGTGLNTAARIVNFADSGQIVFSEQFCNEWEESGHGSLPKMWPPLSRGALSIPVKHGIRREIRFGSNRVSPRMSHLKRVGSLIYQELGHIEKNLLSLLDRVTPSEVVPRLSIFQIERGRDIGLRLGATQFRYCADKDVPIDPGGTFYSIDPPSGLGMSFRDATPFALVHLPDPQQETIAYCAAIQKAWSVPPNEVAEWGRKGRSYFSVPLMIEESDVPPSGVLCVDCKSALLEYTDLEAHDVALRLGAIVTARLALLWRLVE